ncbi:protein-cysteine N-palmitoyltransferase Rasp [Phlebotomus argentipes]|uniref:protein-cysteine N-palmitoyltransferase Rasp n=1 Tax=Phlebotomus argentipes TaxID=94469 RepID=UPI0028933EED|nr:protein-cysteine N-palmitoyltransferase Rasp [Phlebotomus argentipes]XP_059621373.1 protein-cysteine N-palmitoyltransferase Rasp [Phlebotomus argentipes]
MVRYLPIGEIGAYLTLNFIFLSYSSYRVFTYSDQIYKESEDYGFSEGWSIFGRPKDDMDYEWHIWRKFLIDHAFLYIIHLLLSQIVRIFTRKPSPFCYAAISIIFIFTRYGSGVTMVFLGSALIFYSLSQSVSKSVFWIVSVVFLMLLNAFKTLTVYNFITEQLEFAENETFEIYIAFAWNLLRCISFGIDCIENRATGRDKDELYSLKAFLGYVFYFPTLHLGPTIVYSRFKRSLTEEYTELDTGKILIFFRDITRTIFWMLFLEAAQHFFYVNNLQTNEKIVAQLDSWALYGFGCLMGQLFHIKYVVEYGISTAFARLDGIDPPRKPKCIYRIHLYSEMWKNFDHGLYEFLFRYIYSELSEKSSSTVKKLMASFVTFVFIYFWHGFFFYISVWALTNYCCVMVETFARRLSKTPQYRQFMQTHFSESWEYRWNAALGTILLIPAIISNFFFLGNFNVGIIFIRRTFGSGFLHYACVFGGAICMFFTSEFIKRHEKERQQGDSDKMYIMREVKRSE